MVHVLVLPMRADILHLNSRLRLDIAGEILALLHGVALVSFFVGTLELHVGRWARSPQNGDPVCQDVALGEWPVTVLLLELVGVEILSRGLTTANQEQVVRPQGGRVGHRDDAIDHHGPRYAPLGDGGPKRNSFAVHIK